jgi:phosphate transport system protein
MQRHFHRDLDLLRKRVLAIGGMVEAATEKAIAALLERRLDLAEQVIDGDEQIDRKEIEVETECLKILALHQPVAQDLRFIITVLKVNNDLERIGDLAGNIAERAAYLACREAVPIPPRFREVADRVKTMVKKSLDALLEQDAKLAREVLRSDDAVDALYREMFEEIQEGIRRDPERVEQLLAVLSSTRNLERIADQATNVAEDVVFLVEGEVIRHGRGLTAGPGAR